LRLLVAEDDGALGRFLERGFAADGYEVFLAADGEAALRAFEESMPDLVVLDLNLPRRDGTEVLHRFRAQSAEVPVLILTGRTELATRLRCLDLGADDCMLKPFSLAELKARCRALLRRRQGGARLILRYQDLEVNRVEHTVERGGRKVELTKTEYALLECLLLHRGAAVSRAELLQQVWNESAEGGTNIVDVYINYVRRKLGDDGPVPLIQTVRGRGYAVGMQKETRLGWRGEAPPMGL
jgi:DNA-binding response OmpR family regulator